jgi:hypothetical protein
LELAKELDAERLVTSSAHIKIFTFFNNGTSGLYQSGCKCDGPGTTRSENEPQQHCHSNKRRHSHGYGSPHSFHLQEIEQVVIFNPNIAVHQA